MHTRRPRHRPALFTVVLALALALTGCGGADDAPAADQPADDPADAPAEDPAPPDDDLPSDGDGAAGGTTMRVHTVSEALSAGTGESLHVVGLLIDDGSGWRLCGAVLESYPPQCGGDALQVEGLDPAGLPLEESGDVRWQTDATVVGTIDGDTLTVTGSPAAS